MDIKPRLTTPQAVIEFIGSKEPDQRFQLNRRIREAYGAFESSTFWHYREAHRFITGEYVPVLPYDNDWYSQITMSRAFIHAYPHIAPSDPTMISWVPNAEYGIHDRRVIGKPGRMLMAHFGLAEASVAQYVNRFNAEQRPCELRFAETREEIYRVYLEGPNSCMSKGFNANANPLSVYVTPHIKVAYAVDAKGGIVARTVCRFDRPVPQYTRIYGNEFALRKLLKERGYMLAVDGLAGIMLGEPLMDEARNALFIAYLDTPAQQLKLDWKARTIQVVNGGGLPGETHFYANATSADGRVVINGNLFYAWKNHEMYVAPKPPDVYARFFASSDTDDDGNVECAECSDHYHPDECEVTVDGYPVCSGCIDEYFVHAVIGPNERRAWVHRERQGLEFVECMEEYCFGICPDEVFPIVMGDDGWISQDQAVFSVLEDTYIHRDNTVRVHMHDDNGDRDVQFVSNGFFDRYMNRFLIVSDLRVRHVFNHRFYYNEEERTAHVEEIATEVAEEVSAARRSIAVESAPEFAERFAELVISAESARDRTDLLAPLPNSLATLIRSRVREVEGTARAVVPRSAA